MSEPESFQPRTRHHSTDGPRSYAFFLIEPRIQALENRFSSLDIPRPLPETAIVPAVSDFLIRPRSCVNMPSSQSSPRCSWSAKLRFCPKPPCPRGCPLWSCSVSPAFPQPTLPAPPPNSWLRCCPELSRHALTSYMMPFPRRQSTS